MKVKIAIENYDEPLDIPDREIEIKASNLMKIHGYSLDSARRMAIYGRVMEKIGESKVVWVEVE